METGELLRKFKETNNYNYGETKIEFIGLSINIEYKQKIIDRMQLSNKKLVGNMKKKFKDVLDECNRMKHKFEMKNIENTLIPENRYKDNDVNDKLLQQIIGSLNYIAVTTRPNISFRV